MSTQGIMEISNEVIPVIIWQRHKCTAHDYEFNLKVDSPIQPPYKLTLSILCPSCANWANLPVVCKYGLYLARMALIEVGSYPVYDCVEYSKSESGPPGQYTQIFPVKLICGHRWGLHMTATTAIPLAVRTGFAFSLGTRAS